MEVYAIQWCWWCSTATAHNLRRASGRSGEMDVLFNTELARCVNSQLFYRFQQEYFNIYNFDVDTHKYMYIQHIITNTTASLHSHYKHITLPTCGWLNCSVFTAIVEDFFLDTSQLFMCMYTVLYTMRDSSVKVNKLVLSLQCCGDINKCISSALWRHK